ncbi:MAG: hypothetical protein WCV84_03675 [Patescibacteria group bacterium]|jgi:hypothetical protein
MIENKISSHEGSGAVAQVEEPKLDAVRTASSEHDPDVVEFFRLVDQFEAEHSLEALFAIVDLKPKDAPSHPIREPARRALAPIRAQMKKIEHLDRPEITARWRRVSQAVGMINSDKVHHDR